MYIARQPIFNRVLDVYGYELLYRSGEESKGFDGTSDFMATAVVISGLFESGIEALIEDKKAFVNFDAHFLSMDLTELIDADRLVVEVLETVRVDEELVERLQELKKKGYKIALDDFVESYHEYPLVPMADIIKYDILATPLEQIKHEVKRAIRQGKILLAEKIEDEETFQAAKELGFHLFQGYFFSRPNIVGKATNRSTAKAQYVRLLTELKQPEPSYQALAEIIEKDVNLAYRLMKVISSRAGDDLVYSIKRALTYMGLREIERWVSIMMLRDLNEHKPQELMRLTLVRTKFSELIAKHSSLSAVKHEASMMGLFSTIDAMLDQRMLEALDGISLPKTVMEALITAEGILGPIYKIVRAYEQGDWQLADRLGRGLGLTEDLLYDQYRAALIWAKDIVKMMYE